MRHTIYHPSLAAVENAKRAGVAVLAALALVAAGAGTAPSDARAMDDGYGSGSAQHESPVVCKAAIPACGVHGRPTH